jgi:hypothetical protein
LADTLTRSDKWLLGAGYVDTFVMLSGWPSVNTASTLQSCFFPSSSAS